MDTKQLVEYKGVRQRDDEGWRRWFMNDYFDVILWFDREGGTCTGFQVCYARNTLEERAFSVYGKEQGHRFVQERKELRSFGNIGTAVLHGDAGAIPAMVIQRLQEQGGDVPPEHVAHMVDAMVAWNSRNNT